jgi:hypothetical protein
VSPTLPLDGGDNLRMDHKHRSCIRNYETQPEHHKAMVCIAMTMPISRRLARTEDR